MCSCSLGLLPSPAEVIYLSELFQTSSLWENSKRWLLGQVCGRTAGGHRWVRFVGELQEVAVRSGLWGKQQEVTVGSGLWKNSRRLLLGQVCGRTAGGGCWVRFVGEQQEVTVGSGLWENSRRSLLGQVCKLLCSLVVGLNTFYSMHWVAHLSLGQIFI